MSESIVFYCKNCKGMFFAAANEPENMDKETTQDIADFLRKGHIMKIVEHSTVRQEFGGCKC